MVDPHDIPMPRTLLHGLGAAALTLLAFGLGPAVGLTAAQGPMIEVIDGPIEGAPEGVIDVASFQLTLEEVGPTAPGDAVPSAPSVPEERPPSDAPGDEGELTAAAEAVGEPRAASRAAAPPAPAAATEAEPDVPGALELARSGRRPTVRPKGKRCEVDGSNPKIRRDARGAFTVDRSLVTWYITHLRALNGLGWSSKHEGPDGRSVGMRIGGVRCGNDLHLAGIRSGDVVHRVNGHEIRSIPQAILVYRKVRKDRSIRVELTRRGKPVALTYQLT